MPSFLTPNEVANKALFVGTEAQRGDAVVPDYKLTGQYTATESSPLDRTEETTGGFDRVTVAKRGRPTFNGSYTENLTYQSLAELTQYFLRAGAVGATDGNAVPGYTYAKSPAFNLDDVATFTAQHYVDGLGFQNAGVRFSDWTISGDVDNASGTWQFSGTTAFRTNEMLPGFFEGVATGVTDNTLTMTTAGWTIDEYEGAYVYVDYGTHVGEVNRVLSNTADTLTFEYDWDTNPDVGAVFLIAGQFPAGIATPDNDAIEQPGTILKIAADAAGLATASAITDRVISWNVTGTQELVQKAFMDNARTEYSARVGKGPRFITGAARFEFDRYDEWIQWRNTDTFALGIYKVGPEINPDGSNFQEASIVLPKVAWDEFTPDERATNLTATISFLALLPPSDPIITLTSKTTLATLP